MKNSLTDKGSAFTVIAEDYLFDRHNRWDFLTESLKYCQVNKGLQLYHFVFMLNHMHLIAGSRDMINFIRDFKTFTSKEIKKNLRETEPKRLKLFMVAVQCALLHDVIEDTAVTFEQVKASFGPEVAAGVLSLSKNAKLDKQDQLVDSLDRIRQQPREIGMVKLDSNLPTFFSFVDDIDNC